MNHQSVQIHQLTKAYGKLPVLASISLSVTHGEFVAIVGPSGCGKSTLLKSVGGLVPPSSGTVLLDGVSPQVRRREGYLGFVFQNPVLLPWRTLEENVRLPLEVLARSGKYREKVAEIIDRVGLSGFGHAYPRELSGGMQQRGALARTLLYEPSLLLMDEPFGAVDELTRSRLNFELLRLWESSKPTVLFVTHAVDEAVLLADRVVILTPRPASIFAEFVVHLPRPRTPAVLDMLDYSKTVQCVRDSLNSTSAAC